MLHEKEKLELIGKQEIEKLSGLEQKLFGFDKDGKHLYCLNNYIYHEKLFISALLSIYYNSTRTPLETSLSVKNAALSRLRERLLSKTYEASQENECSLSGDREKPASQRSKLGSRGGLVQ